MIELPRKGVFLKTEHPFDRKSMEKELFATYKTGDLKGRRTRTFLRKMARSIEHGYEVGFRDASAGKPMISPEPAPGADDSSMKRDVLHRTYVAYCEGYMAGIHRRKEV